MKPTKTYQAAACSRLQMLADDPDDLLRELQQLATRPGGSPSNTIISVDGFQESSNVPPKGSIASVHVALDQYSAEYQEAPSDAGRIEIRTKPGRPTFHGALFGTFSNQSLNAKDPFAVSRAALGKQRFGFELSGPLVTRKGGFAISLEHRTVTNFAVVNAIALDSSGAMQNIVENVPTPQRLWLAAARGDWPIGSKNSAFLSYTPYVNLRTNVGVGGINLPDTGYSSDQYGHILRFGDTSIISEHLVHELRIGADWRGVDESPSSTAPQIEVSGSFTSGGSQYGPQRTPEFRGELDDDTIIVTKQHSLKTGLQLFGYTEHQQLTSGFNGLYIFGGGIAPVLAGGSATSQTTTITGIEQYRRALLGLPGGSPTAYSLVSGSPQVNFSEVHAAVYAQDEWKVGKAIQASYGLRYSFQTAPVALNGATPRFGFAWTPDRAQSWRVQGHLGLFSHQYSPADYAEIKREDGINRVTSTVYNPTFSDPLSNSSEILHSVRTIGPGFHASTQLMFEVGVEKTLFKATSVTFNVADMRVWGQARTVNTNSPINSQPYGQRPGPVNVNILQLQNSGIGSGDRESVSLASSRLQWLTLSASATRFNLRATADSSIFSGPQSSRTDAGEYARLLQNALWEIDSSVYATLPYLLQISAMYTGYGDQPYNITTGFDNNGDGDFNDRPQFATPGQAGSIHTPYGMLVSSGGVGTLRRNTGKMPWTAYLDANVQRTFHFNSSKSVHRQTVTLNLRSSNILNHLNVTAVGGVLGSPFFGIPYAGDNGRRIEYGVRYSF